MFWWGGDSWSAGEGIRMRGDRAAFESGGVPLRRWAVLEPPLHYRGVRRERVMGTVTSRWRLSLRISSLAEVPALESPSIRMNADASSTGRPLNMMMMSPGRTPAAYAADWGAIWFTSAPRVFGAPTSAATCVV